MTNSDDAIRSRLQELAREYSQAEIARKSDTSPMNVSRYLGSTRIPAEFVAGIVAGLGVNANWLLTGSGVPRFTEGGKPAANELLDILQALESVSRLRAGTIAGKEYARTLRGIQDTLDAQERILQRIEGACRETFDGISRELSRALNEERLLQAGKLLRTAEVLARLSHDPAVAHEVLQRRAHLAWLENRPEEAVELQRQAAAGQLARGPLSEESQLADMISACKALEAVGRREEALQTLQAAEALTPADKRGWSQFALAAALRGGLQVDRGSLQSGLAALTTWRAKVPAVHRDWAEWEITHALMFADALDADSGLSLPARNTYAIVNMLEFCLLEARPEQLERALSNFDESDCDLPSVKETGEYQAARALLRAARHKDRGALRAVQKLPTHKPPQRWQTVVDQAVACRIARALGDRRAAAKHLEQAEAARGTLPPHISMYLIARVLHYSNALNLPARSAPARKLKSEAETFFETYEAAGYHLLRRLRP